MLLRQREYPTASGNQWTGMPPPGVVRPVAQRQPPRPLAGEVGAEEVLQSLICKIALEGHVHTQIAAPYPALTWAGA